LGRGEGGEEGVEERWGFSSDRERGEHCRWGQTVLDQAARRVSARILGGNANAPGRIESLFPQRSGKALGELVRLDLNVTRRASGCIYPGSATDLRIARTGPTMNEQDRPSTCALLPRTRHARPPRPCEFFHTGHGLDDIPDQPSGTTEHPAYASCVFPSRARGLGRGE
jgi:hypothetical protein